MKSSRFYAFYIIYVIKWNPAKKTRFHQIFTVAEAGAGDRKNDKVCRGRDRGPSRSILCSYVLIIKEKIEYCISV